MQKQQDKKVKVALITGAGRRIGAEIARSLHADGMKVILHYSTSEKEAKKLCVQLNKQRKNSAITIKADLSMFANLNAMIQEAVKMAGRLDVLVNNASVFYKTAIGKISSDTWDKLIDINLKAPFFLAQAAFPYLAKQKGSIVNLIDIHGSRPMSDYPVYCISKAGLQMLTQTLARELGPRVRVNAVSPGTILWPEGENSLSASDKQKLIDRIALQRRGDVVDIAKAVLFLVRDANYTTGHNLIVDGGRLLSG